MAHSGQDDAQLVFDPPVVDVAGDEVSGPALCWIVFIALHMDEDRDFGAVELVDDTLLALGYRDSDEREVLAQDGQPHVLAVVRALDHMRQKRLVGLVTAGRPVTHYKLTAEVVDDILKVRDGIGQFWGFAGSVDAIDSYAELGLLAIIALRIQGGKGESREDLLNKLASLLGDRSEDARELALADLLSKLKFHDYVEDERDLLNIDTRAAISRLFSGEKEQRPVFGTDWALNDKAWGGLSALRDGLSGVFRDQALPGGGALANSDDSQEFSSSVVEQPSRAPEASRRRPRSRDRMRHPSPPPATDEPIVSDIDLCVATLLALPRDPNRENHPPRERDIIDEVASKLDIPESWMQKDSAGPWVASGGWAKMVKARKRVAHLLAYRVEHVFRALSIEQVGLIHDVAVNEGNVGRWALTDRGLGAVQVGVLEQEDAGQILRKNSAIPEYFRMHSTTWRAEDAGWVHKVLKRFRDMSDIGPEPGVSKMEAKEVRGRAFELLIRDLSAALDEVSSVEVQDSNEYLDRAGVDLVVKSLQVGMRERPTATLVQCKYAPVADVTADAASKLFATTVWLRGLAQRKEIMYEVTGARVVFMGDLSREATWTFWALKAAWESMTAASHEGDTGSDDAESNGTAANLVWEVWDSWKVFQLMKEHKIGVRVDQSSGGELVDLDEDYFKKLENRVRQRASTVVTRNRGAVE